MIQMYILASVSIVDYYKSPPKCVNKAKIIDKLNSSSTDGTSKTVKGIDRITGQIPAKKVFFGEPKDASRAINLYSLAMYLNKWDDKSFLLKDVDNVAMPKIKKREKVIKENMSGIIDGLSIAVSKLATSIIRGDTSIFKDVMDYQSEFIKKQYP